MEVGIVINRGKGCRVRVCGWIGRGCVGIAVAIDVLGAESGTVLLVCRPVGLLAILVAVRHRLALSAFFKRIILLVTSSTFGEGMLRAEG